MCQKTYDVQQGERCPKKDNSYRQFICIILVFTAVCVLFVIIGNVSFKKPKTKHYDEPDQDDVELMPNHVTSKLHKYERLRTTSSYTTSTTTSKPIIVTARTTTTTTSTPNIVNLHTTTTTTSNPTTTTTSSPTTTTTSSPTTTTTSSPTTTTNSKLIIANGDSTTTTTSKHTSANAFTPTTTTTTNRIYTGLTTPTSNTKVAGTDLSVTEDAPVEETSKSLEHDASTFSVLEFETKTDSAGFSASTDVPDENISSAHSSPETEIDKTTKFDPIKGFHLWSHVFTTPAGYKAVDEDGNEKTTKFEPLKGFHLWSHIFTTPAGYRAVDEDVIVFNETLASHEDLLATGINSRSGATEDLEEAFEGATTRTTSAKVSVVEETSGQGLVTRSANATSDDKIEEETSRGASGVHSVGSATTTRPANATVGDEMLKGVTLAQTARYASTIVEGGIGGEKTSTLPTQATAVTSNLIESRTTKMEEKSKLQSTSTTGGVSRIVDQKVPTTANLEATRTTINEGRSFTPSTRTTGSTAATESEKTNATHEKTPVDTTTAKAKVTGVENTELFRKSTPACYTSGCKSLGSRMLNLMDDSVDACEDFYAFSCGGMQGYTAVSDTYGILLEQTMRLNQADLSYLVKFRRFYNSCIDFHYGLGLEERIVGVKTLLRKYECDWPEAFERKTVTDLLAILLNLNALPFLKLGHAYYPEQGKYIPRFSLEEERAGFDSALWLNRRRCLAKQRSKIYEADLNLAEVYESYRKCMEHDLREFGGLLREAVEKLEEHDVAKSSAEQTFQAVVEMLVDFPSKSEIEEDMAMQNYTVFKMSDLEKNIPSIDWRQLLSTLTNRKYQSGDLVQVYSVRFLKRWLKEFANIKDNKYILLNLLRVHLYYNFVVRRVENVEDHCIRTTSAIFNDVSSKLYLEHFDKKTLLAQETRAIEVFNMVKQHMAKSFSQNSHTTSAAFKLQKISGAFSVGTADAKLEGEYGALDISDVSYLDNVVNATAFQNRHFLDFTGVFASSYEEHPLATYQSDTVCKQDIPMGMVVGVPLSAPKHIVLAKIGYKLAQALSKYFDPVGLKLGMTYDPKLYDILVVNTNLILEEMFSKPSFHAEPNKHLTLLHRVYDNTALRLVSELYESIQKEPNLPWISERYEAEQVMYIAIGQEFCEKQNLLNYAVELREGKYLPGPFRLENIVQHSEKFQSVFQCREGSGMNNNPFKTQFPHIEGDLEEEPHPEYANYE